MYQRAKIQEESLFYEQLKSSGELPIIGVNTFVNPDAEKIEESVDDLTRATPGEKKTQLDNLRSFQKEYAPESGAALARLQKAALSGDNIFAELMKSVRVASLGQITRPTSCRPSTSARPATATTS